MLKAQRSSLKQVSRDRKSISWLPRVGAVRDRRGVTVSRFGVSFGGVLKMFENCGDSCTTLNIIIVPIKWVRFMVYSSIKS